MVAGLTGNGEHAVTTIILKMVNVVMELRQEHVQILPHCLEELIVQDHHIGIVQVVKLILNYYPLPEYYYVLNWGQRPPTATRTRGSAPHFYF